MDMVDLGDWLVAQGSKGVSILYQCFASYHGYVFWGTGWWVRGQTVYLSHMNVLLRTMEHDLRGLVGGSGVNDQPSSRSNQRMWYLS